MNIQFYDALKPEETQYLEQIDNVWYTLGQPLIALTPEQKAISKTEANYSFTMPNNDNQFFCHFNEETKTFCLSETISDTDHTVWLKNKKNISFYDGNIVLRDYHTQTSEPFQNPEKISQLIAYDYQSLEKNHIKNIVQFDNPLRPETPQYLEKIDGSWYTLGNKLVPLTPEQKSISKTNANYSFTIPNNDNVFFCHFNEETKTFSLSETVSKDSHDVWLKDMKSVTFYEGNIVLRDHNNNTSEPFQNPEKISQLISEEYNSLGTNSKNKNDNVQSITELETTKNIDAKPLHNVIDRIKSIKDSFINKIGSKNKNSM